MKRKQQVATIGMLVIVLLAGCLGGVSDTDSESQTESTPSLSEVHIESQSDHPVIVFNETVTSDTNATVRLEYPNGENIHREATAINGGVDQIPVSDPIAGDYTLNLVQNNQTVDTKTVAITTATPRVNVTTNWDAATLSQVSVQVTNEGDLSTNASVDIKRESSSIYNTTSESIISDVPTMFSINSTNGLYTAKESGRVNLTVVVGTETETIERGINHTIESPDIDIHSVTPVWQTTDLQEVNYSVSNSGDLPETLDGSVNVEGSKVVSIDNLNLKGKARKKISTRELADINSGLLYQGSTGAVETTVRLTNGSNSVSESNITTVTSTSSEILNVETKWTSTNDGDVGLSEVSFSVKTGESNVKYNTIKVENENQTVIEDGLNPGLILDGVQVRKTHFVGGNKRIQLSPSEHELTISLLQDDELVVERTAVVTAEA
jgi:hypothetical protein